MNVTLVHQFLERQAEVRPDAILVVDGDQQATYGEINANANSIAATLIDLGVNRGDRIGLVAVNSRRYIEAYYGVLKAAAVVVPLNAAADWRSHTRLLDLCGARGVICGERMMRRAEGLDKLQHLEFIIGSAAEYSDRLTTDQRIRFLDHDNVTAQGRHVSGEICLSGRDRAAIVYTSGSTGEPKGVVLRHSNLVANTLSIVQYLELRSDDRVLVVLPFHYVYGKSLLNTHVAVGGSVAIENRFSFPQRALDTMEATGATGLSGVPSTFAILLNRSNFATRDLPNLRYVTQAGGAMAPELQRRLTDALHGRRLYVMYGATEASARLAYLDPNNVNQKTGSIGKAIPGVNLKVIRKDGSETDVGEVGELVARGPNIMEGYWNDPHGTAEVLDQDGYHTGDLVWRDEDGFLYVVGRSREMIKSGAHRISPREIEETILEHPLVHEAAVLGVPDEILGEAIVAFVSARSAGQLDSDDITRWCKTRLPVYKVPGEVQVLPELERNAAGKIDKLALASSHRPECSASNSCSN